MYAFSIYIIIDMCNALPIQLIDAYKDTVQYWYDMARFQNFDRCKVSQLALRRGREKGLLDEPRMCLPLKENTWSRHQRLFEENVWKTKMEGRRSAYFENEGSGVIYARGRYWHPTRPSQRTVASNRVKIMTSMLLSLLSLFSLFIFYYFFPFYVFILFFGVDKGVSLAPTYPRVRWGNQTYVVL